MVYFIQNDRTHDIKIGKSDDALKRLGALQTGCPDRLVLLGSIEGGHAEEKALHVLLKRFRKPGGEWFLGAPDLIAEVERLIGCKVEVARRQHLADGAFGSGPHIVVGSFFHTFDEKGEVEYQGRIVKVGSGFVLAQLMSWWDGQPTERKLFPEGALASWKLYGTAEQMRRSYGKLSGMTQKDIDLSEEVTMKLYGPPPKTGRRRA